jgi:pimeloyl-ACP methyl ester carboxylesterase
VSNIRRQPVQLPEGEAIDYLETGDGPPLVYFHGAGGVFPKATFLPELGRAFRVLVPSRPGYDDSGGTCSTAREEAMVMGAFIRNVVGGPVHLVAESAGASSACWLAILLPEMVSDLVLVAPTAFAAHTASPPQSRSAEDIERLLFGSEPAWTEPLTQKDTLQRLRNASANAARLRPADANTDLRERLHEIGVPTLILWATADQLAAPESGQVYSHHIPESYRIYIYGGAYCVPVAACEPFVRLTLEFIQRGEAFIVNPAPALG